MCWHHLLPTCSWDIDSLSKMKQFLPAISTVGLCQRLEKVLGFIAGREISSQDDSFHLAACSEEAVGNTHLGDP